MSQRRLQNQIRMRNIRASQSPEELEQSRLQLQIRMRNSRASKTPEQLQQSKSENRMRMSNARDDNEDHATKQARRDYAKQYRKPYYQAKCLDDPSKVQQDSFPDDDPRSTCKFHCQVANSANLCDNEMLPAIRYTSDPLAIPTSADEAESK